MDPAESTTSAPKPTEISVRSLVVPLDGMALLVPNALVSEVATLAEIQPPHRPVTWLAGKIEWRGLQIPLVSFERLLGETGGAPSRNSRAIVLNTLNSNRQLPFIAILSQRIPRLLLVTARMLRSLDDAELQEGVLSRVDLQGDEVSIPDVDRIEQLLGQHQVVVERATA